MTREQLEDAIMAAPLDGYDLADLASAIFMRAKFLNERFAFDVEPLRNALAELEGE